MTFHKASTDWDEAGHTTYQPGWAQLACWGCGRWLAVIEREQEAWQRRALRLHDGMMLREW